MKTGTGGLKDGSGQVLIVCNSQSEGDDVLRLYRSFDQKAERFDFVLDTASALVAMMAYPPGTAWCVAADTPAFFDNVLRHGFNTTFGPQSHTSQAIGAYSNDYAIDPKELRKP